MTPETVNGIPATPKADVTSLEGKYIELLEKKIEALEKQLGTAGEDPKPADASTAVTSDTKTKENDPATNAAGASNVDRVRNVISVWNKVECQRIDRDASELEVKPKEAHAFIFRKVQDEQGKFWYSEVEIKSVDLQQLLRTNLMHYPGHYWEGDVVTIIDPFSPLVHNWDKLQKVANEEVANFSEEDKQVRSDLKLLLNIVSTSSGVDKLGKYFKERERYTHNRTITYDALWTLFAPGTVVYAAPFLKQEQLFIVGSSYGYFPQDGRGARPWSVPCWGYDWNGDTFERKSFEFEFEKFVGSKSINNLPCFPIEYYENGDPEAYELLKSRLIKRGHKFRELCIAERGKQMFSYQGKVLYRGIGISVIDSATQVTQVNDDEDRSFITASNEEVSESTRRKLSKLMSCELKGTVMVDFLSYFQYADKVARLGDLKSCAEDDECGCPTCRENKELSDLLKFDYDGRTREDEFETMQYLMCPPRVLGYVIERKMWAQLQVDDVKPVEIANAGDTFDKKLKLDEGTKDLLRYLVTNHEDGKKTKDGKRIKGIQDIVQGKGDGLVILLHGPPGVGKTLTAESVAIRAGKPLFAVGVTDVGVDPEKVQVNLERLFDLASSWEAVLLIDEADVFLDSRAGKGGQTDLRRNALVSVLLRVLEYYQGILILTTNRIRDFDVAVQSRIHLAVKYEDLSKEQQTEIFYTFLNQARDKGNVEGWDKICKWVERTATSSAYKFNGRQIRNVVTSAMGLARAGERKLRDEDLAEIAIMTRDFKQETSVQEAVYRASQIETR
ncbi:MAG: hypothetical protein M1837_005043 [Sclerophora amabilis]|nr:MAG: hypothetical protein M1837_005043 [Sclerophora amabilis]